MIELPEDGVTSVGLDLTPLIDIIFIVVVFLLCVANAPMLALDVTVPEPMSSETSADAPEIVVSLSPVQPHWSLNQTEFLSWDAFEAALTEAVSNGASVQLAADQKADVAALSKVLELLNLLGIQDTQLLLQPS